MAEKVDLRRSGTALEEVPSERDLLGKFLREGVSGERNEKEAPKHEHGRWVKEMERNFLWQNSRGKWQRRYHHLIH